MQLRWFAMTGTLAAMLGAGCASTIPREQVFLNESFSQEIDALKRRDAALDSLRDAVERLDAETAAQTQSLGDRLALRQKENDRLGNAVALLGDQVAALEQEVAKLRSAPQAARGRGGDTQVEARYHMAYRSCLDRDFPEAIAGFKRILRESPSHELADNAQYWLAECYYATDQYDQAISEFEKVFDFRQTDKHDDAQLKIAFAYFRKGDKARALAELNRLLMDYPKSDLLDKAREKIAQIEGM